MGDIAFVTNYRAYLTAVRERTVAHKKEGKSLDDTIKLVQDELAGSTTRIAWPVRFALPTTSPSSAAAFCSGGLGFLLHLRADQHAAMMW
jgi:hypothetical protein